MIKFSRSRVFYAALALGSAAIAQPVSAEVSLPHLYSDHMVVQRNQPFRIIGSASPGEQVTVVLKAKGKKEEKRITSATKDGSWSVVFPARAAGGPYTLAVTGNNALAFNDVVFGEVWFCSGQSNMATTLDSVKDSKTEIENANHPQLRIFTSNFATRAVPAPDLVAGTWQPARKEIASQFSAVGYLFGRNLQQKLKVPVGIIVSAAGGTLIESWLNQSGLDTAPANETASLTASFQKQIADYPPATDDTGWQSPALPDDEWPTMTVPGAWETAAAGLEKLDGAVWFRREVTIPEDWAGKDLQLNFSPIDDGDVTYFNGVQVGGMNVDTPNVWKLPRSYRIPAKLVKTGRAVIATRITDQLGGGGFIGKAEEMWIGPEGNSAAHISLAGPWKYQVVDRWPSTGLPTSLYNGMVAPWTSYPVAGVAWYQGESNASNPVSYLRLLPRLIGGWRSAWNQPNMPFLIVQLPEFGADGPQPAESNWAELREVQAKVANQVPNVSLAVTLGLGEAKDIHPKDKQGVADRLTRLALANVYKQKVASSGPTADVARIVGNAIVVSFQNVGKGLVARGGELKGFAIAGQDKKYVWATAVIIGDTVVVQSPEVMAPAYVRYAWANSPIANLENSESLPAAPFQKSVVAAVAGR